MDASRSQKPFSYSSEADASLRPRGEQGSLTLHSDFLVPGWPVRHRVRLLRLGWCGSGVKSSGMFHSPSLFNFVPLQMGPSFGAGQQGRAAKGRKRWSRLIGWNREAATRSARDRIDPRSVAVRSTALFAVPLRLSRAERLAMTVLPAPRRRSSRGFSKSRGSVGPPDARSS